MKQLLHLNRLVDNLQPDGDACLVNLCYREEQASFRLVKKNEMSDCLFFIPKPLQSMKTAGWELLFFNYDC